MTEAGVLRPDGRRLAVRFERTYAAPIDEVWDALTSPERLARWLAPGRIDEVVELDFGDGGIVTGKVLQLREPSLLEFEWHFADETESVVRFELSADGEETRVVLDHRALDARHAPGYAAGWHAHLDGLRDEVGGGSGSWDERFRAVLPLYQEQERSLR